MRFVNRPERSLQANGVPASREGTVHFENRRDQPSTVSDESGGAWRRPLAMLVTSR
jgi:hypothetical protein